MYAKPWLFSENTDRNRIYIDHVEKLPGVQEAIYTDCNKSGWLWVRGRKFK